MDFTFGLFLLIVAAVVGWMAWQKWGHLTGVNPLTNIKAWWATFAKRNLPKSPTEFIAPTFGVQTSPTVRTDLSDLVALKLKNYATGLFRQGTTKMNPTDYAFNEAGIRFTAMDVHLANATALNVNPHNAALQERIKAAHDLVAESGEALAALRKAVVAALAAQPSEPVKPVPVMPTTGYQLTPDEKRFNILWGPAFGEFGARQDGGLFSSHEERKLYVAHLVQREQGGSTPGPAQPTQMDPRSLSSDDWHYYVRGNPTIWGKVQAGPYTNQMINMHSQGGANYNPNWIEANYNGILKR